MASRREKRTCRSRPGCSQMRDNTMRAVAGIFLAFSIVPSALGEPLDDTAAGLAELNRDNIPGAIDLLTKGLSSGEFTLRDRSIVLNIRGLAYHRKGDYKKAKIDYDSSLEIQRDNIATMNNRALLFHQIGEDENALRDYDS